MSNPSSSGTKVRFHLQSDEKHFTVEPSQGVLGPKKKQEIVVKFKTESAKVLVASIVVKLAEGSTEMTRVLKVSAIGKYPFIVIDTQFLDYENLLVGKTATQKVTI